MEGSEKDLTRRDAFERFGRRDTVLIILCGLAVLFAVAHFVDLGRARVAAVCAAVDVAVVRIRWDSRGESWFWCAIVLFLLIQVIVIGFVPFGDGPMPVTGLVLPGLIIYLVDEGIIFLFKRGFGTSPK